MFIGMCYLAILVATGVNLILQFVAGFFHRAWRIDQVDNEETRTWGR
jgi:hypothetical protein